MLSGPADNMSMSLVEATAQVGETLSDDEFVSRFASRLSAVAQRNLSRYLQHKVDPEDITQSVFRTFFRRKRLGEFEIRNWNGAWGLLVRLAICKCRNRATFWQAQCRDVRLETTIHPEGRTDWPEVIEPADAQPRPDEEATIAEVLDSFFAELNEDDRTILAGHLAGYHSPAISVQIGSSEQTVRRRLQQMERKLRNELGRVNSPNFERVIL